MTRLLLGIIVSGAAGMAALLLSSLVVATARRALWARLDARPPQMRARLLAALRLSPAAAGLASGGITLAAFLRYEPVGLDETVGVLLPALCATGLACGALGVIRLARALWQTTRAIRAWHAERLGMAGTLPLFAVDVPFPLVAAVGVWSPRLMLARLVMSQCERREIDAMIAHELAHVNAGDNLIRLLFAASPAVPFMTGVFQEIEQAWTAASEEAADDAARRDGQSALALASALTKVARLATRPAPLIHASAILSGKSVEHRVRRLVDTTQPAAVARHGYAWPAVILAAAGCVLVWTPALRGAYELAEYCVRTLP